MQNPNEESLSDTCLINSDAYELVLGCAIQYFPWKDALALRLVCKKWNEVVSKNWRFPGSVYFRLCNNPLSVETFVGLSKNFPIKQFTFEGLDLETNILGDEATFRRIATALCPSMSSLAIQGCTLSTGRFLELFSFCKNLKHLAIRESPSIFRVDNGIGIVHWSFCYKSVRSNLANLQKLSIAGKILNDVDVWGLGIGIQDLKQLQIFCESKLPMDGINKILKKNCETLKILIVRGAMPFPGLEIDPGTEMKSLYKLNLDRSKIDCLTLKRLELFLEKCPCLAEFRVSHSKLERTTFSKLTPNLVTLRLWNCDYDANSFADAKFPNLQKLSFCTGIQTIQDAFITKEALKGLSICNMPKLTDVDLRILSNGSDYLRSLNVSNQQQLTVLALNNCADIAGPSLREIFKNLTGLLSMSITKCVELNDDNVCPGGNNDKTESLANLEKLKFLDLSGTGIGNKTITECITKMEKLKSIKLNDESIKVNKAGLQVIIKATVTSLKSLTNVSVNKCIVSIDDFKALRLSAPQVKVTCQIVKSY